MPKKPESPSPVKSLVIQRPELRGAVKRCLCGRAYVSLPWRALRSLDSQAIEAADAPLEPRDCAPIGPTTEIPARGSLCEVAYLKQRFDPGGAQ